MAQVVLDFHPLSDGATFWNVLCILYLAIFSAYWLYNVAHLFMDIKSAADIKHFTTSKLGLSERQLQTVTWPEVAARIVEVTPSSPSCKMPIAMCKTSHLSWLKVLVGNSNIQAQIPCSAGPKDDAALQRAGSDGA